jgi:dTMP kinase
MTQKSSGLFIAVDGVDGSGKTTFMTALKQELIVFNRPITQVRAIGEAEFGKSLRAVLLNFNEHTRPVPASELLTFVAAINDCYANHVVPFVKSGGIVVADRWFYSTSVYQGLANARLEEMGCEAYPGLNFHVVNGLLHLMPAPDISVILDVDAPTAIANIDKRGSENSLDLFCKKNIDRMIDRYRTLRSIGGFGSHNFRYFENNPPYSQEKTAEALKDICNQISMKLS